MNNNNPVKNVSLGNSGTMQIPQSMPINHNQPATRHFFQSPAQRASHFPGHFQLSEPRSHAQFLGQAQAFGHYITSGVNTNVGVSSPANSTPNTASAGARKGLHRPPSHHIGDHQLLALGSDMQSNSKDLLHLEAEGLSLDSKLLFCTSDGGSQSLNLKPDLPDKKPEISSVPKSQVLTKVKDFLGVFLENTRKVELEAKKNPEKYDIEALTGEESEYIEMDLMLGVTELHTQEAVSAAESAIASYQPVIDLATNDTTESEDSSDEDDIQDSSTNRSDDDDGVSSLGKEFKLTEKNSPKKALKRKRQSGNRANIVELS